MFRYVHLIIGIGVIGGVMLVYTFLPTFTTVIKLFQFYIFNGVIDQYYLTGNPLDNCNFVYLDMGTNFGVQIR